MRLNSRAVNPRHLENALTALADATSAARVARTLPRQKGTPLPTPLPPSPEADRSVLMAAVRAAKAGASDRELSGATGLDREWVRTVRYQARLNAARYSRTV